jgi:Cdc6-like AAA superfamily ATPase
MQWIREFLGNGRASVALVPGERGQRSFYFERPRVDGRFEQALQAGAHIVVYGPPLQGKTSLVRRHLDEKVACFVDCREDTKRKDIYRNVLTATGFQVVQEVRKKGKLGAKASVKFFDTGFEAGSDAEVETKLSTLTADLSNANDVARLLHRTGDIKHIVLNNFQRLRDATKENLLLDLAVFDEGSSLKIIIVGTWTDPFYLERYLPGISHRFEKISFGYWLDEEVRAYLNALNERLPAKMPDDVMAQAADMTRGNIVTVNQLAALYCQYAAH